MSSSPRGLALVLSNVRFEPELTELDTRRGGEVDEEVLRRLFTELDFTVNLQKDLTVQVHLTLFCLSKKKRERISMISIHKFVLCLEKPVHCVLCRW